MSTPVISVVVPSHRGALRLPLLVRALSHQRISQPWEVVVVLDGDVDGSAAVLKPIAAHLPLRVIQHTETRGVASALNTGYDAAHGAIVLRCDDDLSPSHDLVARHLEWHQSREPTAGPLGVITLTRDVFAESAYALSYGRIANERHLTAAFASAPEMRWRHWAACNSVPKAAFVAVGGFDEGMTHREDSELGFRLARYGVEMAIDPLEIEHRGPARNAEERARRAYTSGASSRQFEERHPETRTPIQATTNAWSRAISIGTRRLKSMDDAARLGHRVDQLLPTLPHRIRGRLIAFAVESAGEAGRRSETVEWSRPVDG